MRSTVNTKRVNTKRTGAQRRGDRGASLVLALAVMLAIGGILGGLVTFLNTSNRVSLSLQSSRNRQYAADAAIEQAIRLVQAGPEQALVGTSCRTGGPLQYFTPPVGAINGYLVRVDCRGVPSPRLDNLNRIVIDRNVLFLACVVPALAGSSECTENVAIIKAKVNFPTNAAGTVTGAFVQSWSVA
jgi:hypothetical protein